MRHGLARRVVALLLSWVFTATTAWAGAPPAMHSRPAPAPMQAPLPHVARPVAPEVDLTEVRAVPAASTSEPVEAATVEPLSATPGDDRDHDDDDDDKAACDVTFFPPQKYTRT